MANMRAITLSTILTLLLMGCGSSSTGAAGSGGTPGTGGPPGTGATGGSDSKVTMMHTFDPLSIEVAEEVRDVCQTWILDNDEPLYVNTVRQSNDGGWHHSNWFFVPETAYPVNPEVEGPDATVEGTWDCDARGYSEYGAAGLGGAFFFQSTQNLGEEQAFPKGAAVEIPPRSMVVGAVHLLNITGAPLETSMSFEVEALPEEEVEIPLSVISYQIGDIVIPPAVDGVPQESRTSLACDLGPVFGRLDLPTDFNVYYVLSHYHERGNYFNLSFVDDDGGRETIFETRNSVGEPLGQVIDPPIHTNGSTILRSECGFLNETDQTIRRGFSQEMCDFIMYTDARIKIGTGGGENRAMGPNEDGIEEFEVDCPDSSIIGLPYTL